MTKAQHAKLNRLQANAKKLRRQTDAARAAIVQSEHNYDRVLGKFADAETAFVNYETSLAEKSIYRMSGRKG
jgi:hypothetical protein